MENNVYDTIIIGAGMAGVAAARTLYQNGIKNILVLEGNNNSRESS
jgi:cation diffusion facilitator CzcD-associated flavoprotein CzcO